MNASILGTLTGTYSIEVCSTPNNARSGRYTITLSELRRSTRADLVRLQTQKLERGAEEFLEKRTPDGMKSAAQKYAQAATLSNHRLGEARVREKWASVLNAFWESQQGLSLFKSSLDLLQRSGDQRGVGLLLTDIGSLLNELGHNKKALEYLTAKEPDLGRYRIIHFATHGLLDSERPELSGLVFSLVDEGGKPQNGFLDLQDVYNLDLSAELVVLSACETGRGKEVRVEGIVGLARGFMYAGAPRVVASLWRVDDVATAELMKLFYTAMLKDGKRPAAALREAQVSMWRQKRWNSPYYWAPFIIQGEWN